MNTKLVRVSRQSLGHLERMARAAVRNGDAVVFGALSDEREHARRVKQLAARFEPNPEGVLTHVGEYDNGVTRLIVMPATGEAVWFGPFSFEDFEPS